MSNESCQYKVGFGQDIHRFIANTDKLGVPIGGVVIPADFGVEAHSDGDVLLHALVDAIFGALALGDIGEIFSDQDMQWQDADSRIFVEYAVLQLQNAEATIVNIDAMILAQQPKLMDYKLQIRDNIANLLNLQFNQVNIKASTTEGLGVIGDGSGIMATVLISIKIPNVILGSDLIS